LRRPVAYAGELTGLFEGEAPPHKVDDAAARSLRPRGRPADLLALRLQPSYCFARPLPYELALHLGGPLIKGVFLILYLLVSTRDADVSLIPTLYGTSSDPHNTASWTSARFWPLAKGLSRRPLEAWTEMKRREFASCCYFATVYSIILHSMRPSVREVACRKCPPSST
jgi:hypothetical protein